MERVAQSRDFIVGSVGNERPFSPYTGEVLGSLAALITRVETIGSLLERLHKNEPKDWDAFVRALEKS